jgi:hypothetical protein
MRPTAPVQIATRFAAALDAEDYEAAGRLLAADCAYDTGTQTLVGSAEILASYRAAGEFARQRLEAVAYSSSVTVISRDEALIHFRDHITCGGESHVYQCQQQVRLDAVGAIQAIRQLELPGERERLQAFFARHGLNR